MNIRTEELLPDQWIAIDVDTYDPIEGRLIGAGKTEQEAIDDLLEQLPDEAFASFTLTEALTG